jgi:hypothetical protein
MENLCWCAPGAMGQVENLARAMELQGQSEQAAVIEKKLDRMMSLEEQEIGMASFAKGALQGILSGRRTKKM